jgi:hypothetical protein
MSSSTPHIIYIGGAGRSGSTLLELILAATGPFATGGELTYLWDRGVRQNQLCSCGSPFNQCSFWQSILHHFYEDLDTSPEVLHQLREKYMSLFQLPRLTSSSFRTKRNENDLTAYSNALSELYTRIANKTGLPFVIDSSKYPAEAFFLANQTPLRISFIHLVRSPFGVVYSWQKKKKRPEIHWKESYMPRYPAFVVASAWQIYNYLFERFGNSLPQTQFIRIRYEDLITSPQKTLETVFNWLNISHSPRLANDNSFELPATHTVSGNPLRFKKGHITLREDTEWKTELNNCTKGLTRALTFPLARRYGY